MELQKLEMEIRSMVSEPDLEEHKHGSGFGVNLGKVVVGSGVDLSEGDSIVSGELHDGKFGKANPAQPPDAAFPIILLCTLVM